MSQPDKDKERRRSKRLAKRRRTARKEPVVLRLFNWTITYEPLPESVSGIKQPSGVIGLDEAQRLNRLMHTDPGEVIQPLRELLARHPDVPAFCTWLAGAYALTGHPAEADAITRLNYERNPTYLFARIALAEQLLNQGRLEEVPAMAGHFDLSEIYPRREYYHVSELAAVAALAVHYFLKIGQIEAAESWLAMLEEYLPESENVPILQAMLERSRSPGITGRIGSWLQPK